LRLDPYLVTAAHAHPDRAEPLLDLVEATAATRRALVHGDASPKNILVGPDGPVVVDAECAWFGDPAFDLAFLLNHLVLKSALHPDRASQYRGMCAALVDGYRAHVTWEPWASLETRAAALLPGLMLARIDGKSPVEYIVSDPEREAVRAFARPRVATAPHTLDAIATAWSAR
jgi:aminoglycoside phosphotransferase (APT) family kinase protein